ncbi:hypothetical protein [Candidatus Coxiella mudrowiae]|uniref:hypothetical protein n=1 Tax=Candidatus Coxiella mudrowiae TaxID=2054173 RepID=UPI000C2826D3|nr:hypothetical protein [Candidatus Coxiella mudrowiae]
MSTLILLTRGYLWLVVLDYESFSSKRGRTLYQRGGVTDWSVSLARFCVSVLELVWVKITPPEPMYWYHEEKPCLSATSQRSRNFSKKEKQRELLILLFILEFITP